MRKFLFRDYQPGELDYAKWVDMGDAYYFYGVDMELFRDYVDNHGSLFSYVKDCIQLGKPMEIAFFIAPVIWDDSYCLAEIWLVLDTLKREANILSESDRCQVAWLLEQLVTVSAIAEHPELTLRFLDYMDTMHLAHDSTDEQTIKEKFVL